MTFINIEIPFLPAKNYKNEFFFFLKNVFYDFIDEKLNLVLKDYFSIIMFDIIIFKNKLRSKNFNLIV